MSNYRILAIDGGGIRGIIPALVLQDLERRTGKRIADLFDLITGTSTGGIVAATLAKPDAAGRPQYTAADLVDLYVKKGATIFAKSFLHSVGDLDGATGPKYKDTGIESVLQSYLGDARLKDTVTPILACAYEIEKRKPWFFRTSSAKSLPQQKDFPLWEVARCTSAAPTYFPPERVASLDGSTWALVDGGVFANDPGMCALADIKAADPSAEILIASMGTGTHVRPIHYQDAKGWGLLKWAKPILDVMFDGMAKTTYYQLEQLLPDVDGEKRFFRFQIQLDLASDELDDTDTENLDDLKKEAALLIQNNDADLDRLAKQLLSPRTP